MEWNETFSVPVSYSGSLADASQTLSLEKQKANTFFFPLSFSPWDFHCIFFFPSSFPIVIIQFVILFFATESSFTVSQGALNVEGQGGKNMSKNSLAGLWIPISMLSVLKTCFKIGCRTGTRPLHRRVTRSLNTCVMHLQTSWTCSNGVSQSLHIHAPMDSSHFLHKLNDTPDAAQRDAQSTVPSGASEVFQRWERWRLGWERWRAGRHANWKRSLRFLMQPSGKESTVNTFKGWLDDRSPSYIQVDQSDLFYQLYSCKEWHQPPLTVALRSTCLGVTWKSCQSQSGRTWKHVSHWEKPSSPCTCDSNNVHECSPFLSITMEPLSPLLPCPFISKGS